MKALTVETLISRILFNLFLIEHINLYRSGGSCESKYEILSTSFPLSRTWSSSRWSRSEETEIKIEKKLKTTNLERSRLLGRLWSESSESELELFRDFLLKRILDRLCIENENEPFLFLRFLLLFRLFWFLCFLVDFATL